MYLNKFYILIALNLLHLSFGIALNPNHYPIELNLHDQATAADINHLQDDQVKQALIDVTATITQVQKLIATDPTLPRLTKGEIQELFENVTRDEYERSLMIGDTNRAKHMRALMLVLPYNTNNYSIENLQNLYTRPPIVKVIDSEAKFQRNPVQRVVVTPSVKRGKVPTTYKPMLSTKPKKPVYTKSVTEKPYSSRYNSRNVSFVKETTPVIRENVKDMLAAIGLSTNVQSTTVKTITGSKPEITPELKDLLKSFGLLTNEEPPKDIQERLKPEGIKEEEEEFKPFIPQTDTLNINEFKPLPKSVQKPIASYRMNKAPDMIPTDYFRFKPLPIPDDPSKQINNEMEEFLKAFGLVDTGSKRSQKALKESKGTDKYDESAEGSEKSVVKVVKLDRMPKVEVDFLTPDLLSVLSNIGIENGRSKSRKIDQITVPLNSTGNDTDYQTLHNLLDTIKQLDILNGNMTEDEIERLNFRHINLNDTFSGPDPVLVHELSVADFDKNEIKRQSAENTSDSSEPIRITLDLNATTEDTPIEAETNGTQIVQKSQSFAFSSIQNQTSLTESLNITSSDTVDGDSLPVTSTTTTTTTVQPVTTDQPRNSLEDSFGADPVTEEPLPPPRRTGFYFMADWNSFLEVGEDPDKVVVRFDPKVGDPSRFIPVNVP